MANYSSDGDLRPYEDIDNQRPWSYLNGAVTSDGTTWTLDNVDAFPDVCTLICDAEQVSATARNIASKTFTVVRGASKAAHTDNTPVLLYNFDFIHAEAKREIDDKLKAMGIDIGWENGSAPKIYAEADLKTPSALWVLSRLMMRQVKAFSAKEPTKAEWYIDKYNDAISELNPRLINLESRTAVWHYTNSAFVDRTVEANCKEGTPFNFLTTSDDFFYWGYYDTFSSLSFLAAARATYGALTWQYWDGDSWATLTVTDGSSGLTNCKDDQAVTWAVPSDWAPYSLSGGLDGRSRYWVRVAAASVTTAGQCWYAGQEIKATYRRPIIAESEALCAA